MEETMDEAVRIISKWENYETSSDYCPNTSLFNHHSREEVLEFMRAVKDLQSALHSLNSSTSSPTISAKKILASQNFLRMARKRLSREFFSLLKTNKDYLYPNNKHNLDHPSPKFNNMLSNHHSDVFTISTDETTTTTTTQRASALADLKLIADCMMSAGFSKKCLKVYKLARKSYVEDTLLKLGIRKLKKSQVVKMDWEGIEERMNKWNNAARFSVTNIFSGERILCDNLFSSNSQPSFITDITFSEICRDSALNVFRIPGKLAKHSKKSPDKLFKYLELYETISGLHSDIEKIFSTESTLPVRAQARSSLARIADAVRSTLTDFEASIQKDNSKVIIAGGGVHPLTHHVMSYFSNLILHTTSLDKILVDYPASLQSPLPESYFEGETTASPVSLHLAWLLLVLLCKLDAKSELYKDSALSYLFLANNLQYVVKKVRGTQLYSVLGEKWVGKHKAKVAQYAANYERNGWGRVMSALPSDMAMEMPLDKVKECFKRFNVEFEEEYRKEVNWVVQDPKLRDEIKASVRKKVDARYRKVYEKYKVLLAKNRERGKIEPLLKFTPEDLENFLSDLLDGPEADETASGPVGPVGEVTQESGQEGLGLQRRRRRLLLLIRHGNEKH